jgi:hypothetical protein
MMSLVPPGMNQKSLNLIQNDFWHLRQCGYRKKLLKLWTIHDSTTFRRRSGCKYIGLVLPEMIQK